MSAILHPRGPRVFASRLTLETAPGQLFWLDPARNVTSNGAAQFAAASSQYARRTNLPLGTAYSASAWVRFDNFNAEWALMAQRHTTNSEPIHYLIQADPTNPSNNTARLYVRDDANLAAEVPSAATFATGTWYHVAMTRDGNDVALYVNGALQGTASAAFGTITVDDHTVAAKNNPVGADYTSFLDGRVDEVSIYDRALSAAEIAALYNGGAGLMYENLTSGLLNGLLAYQDMNEYLPSSGNTYYDRHGSFNMTAINGPTWQFGIADGAAGDYDPAKGWVDTVGSKPFAQSTTASKPTYRTSGGNPRLVFDGVDDRLDHGGPVLAGLTEWTLFTVVDLDATLTGAAGAIYEEYDAGTTDRLGLYHLRGDTPGLERRVSFAYRQGASDIGSPSTVDIAGTGRRVVAIRRSGTTLDLFVDGAFDRANTISGNPLGGAPTARIGSSANTGGFADGAIEDLYAVAVALSDADIAALSSQF